MKSRLQTRMTSGGHVAAISHAMAQFSPSVYYSNITTGIEFYQFVDELESHFDEKKEEIKESLSELVKLIFDRKNLIVSLTVDDEGYKGKKNIISYSKSYDVFNNKDYMYYVDDEYYKGTSVSASNLYSYLGNSVVWAQSNIINGGTPYIKEMYWEGCASEI